MSATWASPTGWWQKRPVVKGRGLDGRPQVQLAELKARLGASS